MHPMMTEDPQSGYTYAIDEVRMVMGGAIEEVLKKTGAANTCQEYIASLLDLAVSWCCKFDSRLQYIRI